MSQFFPPVGGAGVAITALFVVDNATTAPEWLLATVGIIAFIVGGLLWIASPLPNGTMMMGTGDRQ